MIIPCLSRKFPAFLEAGNGNGKWEKEVVQKATARGRDDSGLSVIFTNRARDD